MDERERRDDTREWRLSRSLVKLIVVSVLLNALILAAYLTSTPERSPAGTWAVAAYKAKLRVLPIDPGRDRARLVDMHLSSAEIPTPECIACHGTMLESEVAFHRIHLSNELLPGLQCSDCHHRVDLTPRGNRQVVEWVDVGLCKKCHSEFPGLKNRGAMTPADFEVDCTMCHTGTHAFRHDSGYLSQIIAPKECKGCHGGRVLPWDALHERADWLSIHGREALKNKDSCYACHDFGLKFCDTCHKKKPPSHLPAESWKARHREAARTDTRGCYTCHKIDFCKRCHLSHEAGWKEKHPAYVREHTSTGCGRCHSESFCSYCHTGLSASSVNATDTLTQP